MATNEAFITDVGLGPGELFFDRAAEKVFYVSIHYVAERIFGLDEEIAGVSLAVVFDDDVLFTSSVECTVGVAAGKRIIHYRIEKADTDLLRAVLKPSVKYPANKIAVLFGRDTKVSNFTEALRRFYAGDELEKINSNINKIIEKFIGSLHIFIV